MWVKKSSVFCKKSSVIWAEPYSKSSAEQFGQTECWSLRYGLLKPSESAKTIFHRQIPGFDYESCKTKSVKIYVRLFGLQLQICGFSCIPWLGCHFCLLTWILARAEIPNWSKSRPTGELFLGAATMINWHESILGMNLGWSHIDLDFENMFKFFVEIWNK